MNSSTKIVIGVMIILGVCGFVVGLAILGLGVSVLPSLLSNSSLQYFMTVNEVVGKSEMVNKPVRISGAVIGESIRFDEANSRLSFFIANIPADYDQVVKQGGLAVVLQDAVNDPSRQRIQVIYTGEKPTLLRNLAQVIMVGELHSDGIFYADELLLKCPTRYEDAVPDQVLK